MKKRKQKPIEKSHDKIGKRIVSMDFLNNRISFYYVLGRHIQGLLFKRFNFSKNYG